MRKILGSPYLPLIVIVVVATLMHLFLFIDVRYNDNIFCAYDAFRLQDGTYTFEYNALPGNVIVRRFGLLLPLALLYKLFGVSSITSALVPFLFSLATILVLYKLCLDLFSKKCAIIAATLLTCYPLHFIYATQLYVDIAISFFFCWSSLVFLKATANSNIASRKKLLFYSGLIMGFGHLVKENSFFIFSFFVIYALVRHISVKEIMWIFVGFLVVPFFEAIFYWLSIGDPLNRYHTITREHIGALQEMFFTSTSASLKRMFITFPSMMFSPFDRNFPYCGPFSYLLLTSTVYLIKTKRFSEITFLILWWLTMALCLFFWPIKLSPYIPSFVPWVRTLEPLTIPMVMVIAYALALLTNGVTRYFGYTAIILVIVLSVATNYFIVTYLKSWTTPTKEAFLWLKANNPKIIYTDYLLENKHPMANLLQYWNRFKPGLAVKVFTERSLEQAEDGYVFINWGYVQQNIEETSGKYKPPPQIYNLPSNWEKIYEKDIPKRLGLREIFKNKDIAEQKSYKIQIFKINPLPHNK